MKEKNDAFTKIDEISTSFGIKDSDRTIFEIVATNDPNQRFLNLKSGSWDESFPWFGIDENQNLHTMVSIASLSKLMKAYNDTQKENFNLKLEKTIWQNIPVDFADVWVVAIDEIKKMSNNNKGKKFDVDLEKLLKGIKKTYPNLFVNIKEIMKLKGVVSD